MFPPYFKDRTHRYTDVREILAMYTTKYSDIHLLLAHIYPVLRSRVEKFGISLGS